MLEGIRNSQGNSSIEVQHSNNTAVSSVNGMMPSGASRQQTVMERQHEDEKQDYLEACLSTLCRSDENGPTSLSKVQHPLIAFGSFYLISMHLATQ
jgi:hypothetical protein